MAMKMMYCQTVLVDNFYITKLLVLFEVANVRISSLLKVTPLVEFAYKVCDCQRKEDWEIVKILADSKQIQK